MYWKQERRRRVKVGVEVVVVNRDSECCLFKEKEKAGFGKKRRKTRQQKSFFFFFLSPLGLFEIGNGEETPGGVRQRCER